MSYIPKEEGFIRFLMELDHGYPSISKSNIIEPHKKLNLNAMGRDAEPYKSQVLQCFSFNGT